MLLKVSSKVLNPEEHALYESLKNLDWLIFTTHHYENILKSLAFKFHQIKSWDIFSVNIRMIQCKFWHLDLIKWLFKSYIFSFDELGKKILFFYVLLQEFVFDFTKILLHTWITPSISWMKKSFKNNIKKQWFLVIFNV